MLDKDFNLKSSMSNQEMNMLNLINKINLEDSQKWEFFLKKELNDSLIKGLSLWESEVKSISTALSGIHLQLWNPDENKVVDVMNDSISIENGYKIPVCAWDYWISLCTRNAIVGYQGLAKHYGGKFQLILEELLRIDSKFIEATEDCDDELLKCLNAKNSSRFYFWMYRKPKSSIIL
ncbi:MAG: hypothetical protein HC845_12535 [Akkermansiaceae bacterium]|nr:hypothetical protein [Akkermansiaceae bacterium]